MPISGDGVVAHLLPGMAPNVGARFERDPGKRRKMATTQVPDPLIQPFNGDYTVD